jgi:hypothetical protein
VATAREAWFILAQSLITHHHRARMTRAAVREFS